MQIRQSGKQKIYRAQIQKNLLLQNASCVLSAPPAQSNNCRSSNGCVNSLHGNILANRAKSPPPRPSPQQPSVQADSGSDLDLAARLNQLRINHETMAAFRSQMLNDSLNQMRLRSAAVQLDVNAAIKFFETQERELKEAQERTRIQAIEAAERHRKAEEAAKEAQKAAKKAEKDAKEAALKKQQEEQKAAADAARQKLEQTTESQGDSSKQSTSAPSQKQPEPGSSAKQDPQTAHIVFEQAWKVAGPLIENTMRIKNVVKPAIMANPTLKSILFKSKMTITQRTGQLTRSQTKVIEIVRSLNTNFLEAQKQSPEFYDFIMDLTAKRIIKQAETEVAVKRNMAFPLAVVCVLLYEKHERFLDILLGRFMKKCPYIVPRYMRKLPDESTTDYMKRMSFKETGEDHTLETEIQYGERMCGILSLYAAILQTNNIPNRYGILNAWTWLARILNMKPRRLTPLLLHTFLEVAGHAIMTTYKRQAAKLARYMIEVAIPSMPKSAVASTTRLKLFLEETVSKNGDIPKFENSELEK